MFDYDKPENNPNLKRNTPQSKSYNLPTMAKPRPRVSSQKKDNRKNTASTSQSVMGYLFQSQEVHGLQSPQQSSSNKSGFSSLDLMPVPISSTNIVVSNHPISTLPSIEQGSNELDQEIAALFAEDGHRKSASTRAGASASHLTAATTTNAPASFSSATSCTNTYGGITNQLAGFETNALHSNSSPVVPPQVVFKQMLQSRGYSTKTYSARECGYCTKPTELQVASYGTAVVKAIHSQNTKKLYSLLTCGLSRNPCNVFSDGTLCMSIRRGSYDLFKCQLDAGASIQIADDFGRTPLHFCAWSAKPCFKTVEKILDRDVNMLRVTDNRGKTPLEYLMPKQQYAWMEFLEKKKDVYWPDRGEGWKETDKAPAVVRAGKTNPKTIPDPANALNPVYATMVSYGVKSIQEVMQLIREEKSNEVTEAQNINNNSASSGKTSKISRKPAEKPRAITPAPSDQKLPKKTQGVSDKPSAGRKTKNKRKLLKDAPTKGRKIRKVPSITEARRNTLASRSA